MSASGPSGPLVSLKNAIVISYQSRIVAVLASVCATARPLRLIIVNASPPQPLDVATSYFAGK